MSVPNLNPTAILRELSSSLRPRDETGRAWSHAPEALDITDSNLAWSVSSWAEASKVS